MSVCIRLHLASTLPPVVLQTVKECLQLLNAKDLPIPRFKLANHLNVKWNGLCSHTEGADNTTITLQKRILEDEKTCARVVAHEMCHHVEFLHDAYEPGHGPIFHGYAQKINAVMGSDFVTAESDKDFVLQNTKNFYILIYPVQDGKFVWQVAARLTKELENAVRAAKLHYNCKFYKINDRRLWRSIPNLGNRSSYYSTNSPELQVMLKKLYGNQPKWWDSEEPA